MAKLSRSEIEQRIKAKIKAHQKLATDPYFTLRVSGEIKLQQLKWVLSLFKEQKEHG